VLPPERLDSDDADTRIRQTLARLGFQETIGYAMVGREEDALLAPARALPALAITNPLSERWEMLRRSLLPGLARAASQNLRHGMRDLALFEIGTTFHRLAGRDGDEDRPFREERAAAILGTGRAGASRWNVPARAFDVFDAS